MVRIAEGSPQPFSERRPLQDLFLLPEGQPIPDLFFVPERQIRRDVLNQTPGQGTQRVKLGSDVAEHSQAATAVWRIAWSVLGDEYRNVYLNGPAKEVRKTKYAQPFIIIDAIARAAALNELGLYDPSENNTFLSVGLLATAALTGMVSINNAIGAARDRGEAMQTACTNTPSGLVSVENFGLPDGVPPSFVDELIQRGFVRALENTDTQVGLAASRETIDQTLDDLADTEYGDLISELEVDGGFHSPFMQEGQEAWDITITQLRPHMRDAYPGMVIVGNTDSAIRTGDQLFGELKYQLQNTEYYNRRMHDINRQGIVVAREFSRSPVLTNMNVGRVRGSTPEPILIPGTNINLLHQWRAPAGR